MYYELFNDVFVENENTICIFEIGAFYVVLNEQAIYLSELLGLKRYALHQEYVRWDYRLVVFQNMLKS